MSRPLTKNELDAIAMMVGQQVLGFVATSTLLGHTTLRGSTIYAKGQGPVGDFVWRVMGNNTAEALTALDALIKQFPGITAALNIDDPSELTDVDSADAWLIRCTNGAAYEQEAS